jgi:hypothetical protein
MPAYEQVATAAFRVIRMLGLKGLTVEAVANEMRRQKARPGSRRDLAPFVKFIRADYEKAAITPPLPSRAGEVVCGGDMETCHRGRQTVA